MLFEILVVTEVCLCLLLLATALEALSAVDPALELSLGQRAWAAARFSMAEARELGPLFKHLVAASRHALRQAHSMQERIRGERERRSAGRFRPLVLLSRRRRHQRAAELAELAHLVEQLEQMGGAIARYRAGVGRLMELQVPLSCVRVYNGRREASDGVRHPPDPQRPTPASAPDAG
jgi:hypothetical protein